MKVLFLDIDGVLNTDKSKSKYGMDQIDNYLVQILKTYLIIIKLNYYIIVKNINHMFGVKY
jgi:histidinol phosphatase-like enzyme